MPKCLSVRFQIYEHDDEDDNGLKMIMVFKCDISGYRMMAILITAC